MKYYIAPAIVTECSSETFDVMAETDGAPMCALPGVSQQIAQALALALNCGNLILTTATKRHPNNPTPRPLPAAARYTSVKMTACPLCDHYAASTACCYCGINKLKATPTDAQRAQAEDAAARR